MDPVQLTLSIADLRRHCACYLNARIDDLTARLGYRPADDEPIDLKIWLDLPTTTDDDAAIAAARAAYAAARAAYAAAYAGRRRFAADAYDAAKAASRAELLSVLL